MNDTTPIPAAARGAEESELAALRCIVEGTAQGTGESFFRSLVEHLAAAMGVRFAFVAEFAGEHRARTLAYLKHGRLGENAEWDVRGTPCEDVIRGNLCHHPAGVLERFPGDEILIEWRIESYLGVPLLDAAGRHLGHLAVFDQRAMPAEPRKLFIFRIFAARAAAELGRVRYEKMLLESERRYRELFEGAPNAYLIADAGGRLTDINRKAVELLGHGRDDLLGGTLADCMPDTPEACNLCESLESARLDGRALAAVPAELRRKDGRPLHILLWSEALRDPSGTQLGTRSIWVDVTENVLMQREKARLEAQNQYLREEIKSSHNFEEIVGRGPLLAAALKNVRQVAATEAKTITQSRMAS